MFSHYVWVWWGIQGVWTTVWTDLSEYWGWKRIILWWHTVYGRMFLSWKLLQVKINVSNIFNTHIVEMISKPLASGSPWWAMNRGFIFILCTLQSKWCILITGCVKYVVILDFEHHYLFSDLVPNVFQQMNVTVTMRVYLIHLKHSWGLTAKLGIQCFYFMQLYLSINQYKKYFTMII